MADTFASLTSPLPCALVGVQDVTTLMDDERHEPVSLSPGQDRVGWQPGHVERDQRRLVGPRNGGGCAPVRGHDNLTRNLALA